MNRTGDEAYEYRQAQIHSEICLYDNVERNFFTLSRIDKELATSRWEYEADGETESSNPFFNMDESSPLRGSFH